MKILAVGDAFVPVEIFKKALEPMAKHHDIRFIALDESNLMQPATESEKKLREFAGSPGQLIDELKDEDVLLVHGAPVSDEVLRKSPNLKIVGVARGGPVNVDAEAAAKLGVSILSSPGRNADAVADLAICYAIMMARGVIKSVDFIRGGGVLGESAFEGTQFFGNELGKHTLGLVGYGQVGMRVALRAKAFGMSVIVYDPFISRDKVSQTGAVQVDTLDQLLAEADFVSLHLRASAENESFFNASKFGIMKPGSYFINSARESLVNEQDLYQSLRTGHLAGAAVDVVRPWKDPSPNPLLSLDNLIITPHIGGATFEAAFKGVALLAEQLQQYAAVR